VIETNRSTLHTIYNRQQSATQGSNDTHIPGTLSRRTATTRCSLTDGIYRGGREGVGVNFGQTATSKQCLYNTADYCRLLICFNCIV